MTAGATRLGIMLLRRWVRFYTRELPPAIAAQRQAQIESDLWEQLHDSGTRAGSLDILLRLAGGMRDDLRWREEQMEPGELRKWITFTLGASAVAALLLMGLMTIAAASIKPPPLPAAPTPSWDRRSKEYPPPPPPPPPPRVPMPGRR